MEALECLLVHQYSVVVLTLSGPLELHGSKCSSGNPAHSYDVTSMNRLFKTKSAMFPKHHFYLLSDFETTRLFSTLFFSGLGALG